MNYKKNFQVSNIQHSKQIMSDGDGDLGLLNEAVAHLEATASIPAGGGGGLPGAGSGDTGALLSNDVMSENYWLREKLREIQSDRDRLLCEVANLRLELDMGELMRMPEDR